LNLQQRDLQNIKSHRIKDNEPIATQLCTVASRWTDNHIG